MTGAALTEPECQVLRFCPSVCLSLSHCLLHCLTPLLSVSLSHACFILSVPVSLKYCLCHSQQSDSHYLFLACLTFSIFLGHGNCKVSVFLPNGTMNSIFRWLLFFFFYECKKHFLHLINNQPLLYIFIVC